jgi:methylmalonyl-CoA/ethylmalonyl-CoA epimerase
MNEQTPKEKKEIFKPIHYYQVGIVVKNIDETIQFYEKVFGFGPFEVVKVDFPTATYYGKTAGYRGKRAFFYLGPIHIELIELIDGKTVHEDFLREKGEGIHHIGFEVENLEEAKAMAEKAGLKVTQSFMRPDGAGFVYVDSDKVGGVIFELIKRPTQNDWGKKD